MTCARSREFEFQTSQGGEELFGLSDASRDAAFHEAVRKQLSDFGYVK